MKGFGKISVGKIDLTKEFADSEMQRHVTHSILFGSSLHLLLLAPIPALMVPSAASGFQTLASGFHILVQLRTYLPSAPRFLGPLYPVSHC